MELTLTAGCWIKFCKWLARVICLYNYCNLFYPLLVNRYYDRFLPLFRQFLLLPNRSNKFMNFQANCSTPALISSAGIWSIPGDFWLFSLSIANSNSAALGSGTSGSAVCISACLTSLIPARWIHSLVFSLEDRAWQEPEPTHVTGMALAHCIVGNFLGVVCHCFPPPLDVPTERRERS